MEQTYKIKTVKFDEFRLDLGEGHNLQIDFFSKDFGDQIIKTIFFWRILDFKASKRFFPEGFWTITFKTIFFSKVFIF